MNTVVVVRERERGNKWITRRSALVSDVDLERVCRQECARIFTGWKERVGDDDAVWWKVWVKMNALSGLQESTGKGQHVEITLWEIVNNGRRRKPLEWPRCMNVIEAEAKEEKEAEVAGDGGGGQ